MKDQEFIELLNLYLDHEISPADATRLETEVQRNPERRRVYQDYCRMHKACTLLATEQTASSPSVIAFEPERPMWRPKVAYAFGGLMAAAACAAFVFLKNSPAPVSGNSSLVVESSPTVPTAQPTSATARTIAQTVTVPTRRTEFQSVVAPHSLRLTDNPLVATETPADVKFDWMEKMQFSSLSRVPSDALRFEATKATLKTNSRSFGPAGTQDATESAAWQFQR